MATAAHLAAFLPPFHYHPVYHHPTVQIGPDQLQHPFVFHHPRHPCHEYIVVHPVKELFQVDVHHPFVACLHVLLGLLYGLLRTPPRSKPITVLENIRSNSGVSTCAIACWSKRSITVGIPNCLTPPSGLGISTRLTGLAYRLCFLALS